MARVDNIGNQSIQLTGADIVKSEAEGTEVVASNQTVTVNVLDPAPNTVPYWDSNKAFVPATLAQIAQYMVVTPEAEAVLEAAAVNAGVNTLFKAKTVPPASTINLSVADGSYFKVNLTSPQTTLQIASFVDTPGYVRQLTLEITQGTGSNKITWPSRIRWVEGRQPPLSYLVNRIDMVVLTTSDSGSTFLGSYNGGWA